MELKKIEEFKIYKFEFKEQELKDLKAAFNRNMRHNKFTITGWELETIENLLSLIDEFVK